MSRPDLLEAFLCATDEQGASAALEAVVGLVQRVVTEVLARRLRALREEGGEAILDLPGYVAVVSNRVCDGYLRQKFPERARFVSRVRYVIARHPDCRVEERADGKWCGLPRQAGVGRLDGPGRAAQLAEGTATVPALSGRDVPAMPLPELVTTVLEWLAAPVPVGALIAALVALCGVHDRRVESLSDDAVRDWWTELPSPAEPDHISRLDAVAFLRPLWKEIAELPPNQRAALLLNLRDEG